MLNVVATQQPDDANRDRPDNAGGRGREMRRRLPEHLQMRMEMPHGRRIDLNLRRSRQVKFDAKRRRDEDDVDVPRRQRRQNRVFIGERGRVTPWTADDNEVNNNNNNNNTDGSKMSIIIIMLSSWCSYCQSLPGSFHR